MNRSTGILERAADLFESIPLLLFVSLAVSAYIVHSYGTWRRLSHVPGPSWAGISTWWLLKNTFQGQLHLILQQVCERYGPLVRIGPNELVTGDPDTLRRLTSTRSKWTRAVWYEGFRFSPGKDNIVTIRDDAAHNALRTKMAAAYAGKETEGLEQKINEQVLRLIALIERKYVSTTDELKRMDLAQKAQYFTLDVITTLAFSKTSGFLDADDDVGGYIEVTEKNLPMICSIALYPFLVRLVHSRLFRWMVPSESDVAGFGHFVGVVKKVIGERLESSKADERDMVAGFMARGLTREEIESEALVAVAAGSDTTAGTIRATLLYLMTSPSAYAALKAEVLDAIQTGRASSPITDTEAHRLRYLQAVIKEGLRKCPPGIGISFIQPPAGGDVVSGFRVPPGTSVGASLFAVTGNKEVFGHDADMFRPERWLEASGERLQRMNSVNDLIFRAGKWQCLGKSIALIELNKVYFELLRRYDLALVDPTHPWDWTSAAVHFQKNLWVRVTRNQA